MASTYRQHEQHPFLVLPENRMGVAAIKRLGPHTRRRTVQLVTLVGPSGTGKSRLARELIRSWEGKRQDGKIVYVTASQFAADLAESSVAESVLQFQLRYRNEVTLLVCEDLQTLANRPETQVQLTSAIDDVVSQGGCVLLTSTAMPREISGLSKRLSNRIRGGLCVSLTLPNQVSRMKLISHFLESESVQLAEEEIGQVAENFEVSARELLGIIEQLRAWKNLNRNDPDLLKKLDPLRENRVWTLKEISKAVAREFRVKVEDMKGPGRSKSLMTARQVAMFLARERTTLTLKQIGEFFGRGHHSTVIHACQKVEERLSSDPALSFRIESIVKVLEKKV